jgi:hypothetical protein
MRRLRTKPAIGEKPTPNKRFERSSVRQSTQTPVTLESIRQTGSAEIGMLQRQLMGTLFLLLLVGCDGTGTNAADAQAQVGQPNQSSAAAPPKVCEIRQETWCIYRDFNRIEDQFSSSETVHSIWTLSSAYWERDRPLVIMEPHGCRHGLSDTVQLLGQDARYDWNGRSWNRLRVRLKSDGQCDLQLLSPTLADDQQGSAFFAGLDSIRACTTQSCEGPPLGERIRGLVERQ